jgi:glutamine cyclotransferase
MTTKSRRFKEDEYLDFATYDWGNNVLNGVAYDSKDDSFIVSGKMWHHIFKVKLDYRDSIQKH